MQVKPVASPHAVAPVNTNVQAAAAARQRAIETLAAQAPAQAPTAHPTTLNQNAISPEDHTAVAPTAPTSTEPTQTTTQAQDATQVTGTEPKAEDPISRQYANLAKQERALRMQRQQQEQQIRAREQALQAKEDAIKAKELEYNTGYISKSRIKEDALGVLAEAEVSYDELTQQILNQGNQDPRAQAMIRQLQQQIQALKSEVEGTKKSYTESQETAYQGAIKQIQRDVTHLVNADPAFETIKTMRAQKDVVRLIEQTFKDEGYVMGVDEAAELVENELVERALKLASLNKVKSRLQPAQAVAQAATPAQPSEAKQMPMKTLTNANSVPRKLSTRERAILAMRGELK